MNEKEAIIKLKTCNDKAAFAFLYRSYWAKVYNFTRLYITSAVDVEEIVQEVFIKIWENREALDEEQNFAGYLFITMRNLVFNRSRKNLNEPCRRIIRYRRRIGRSQSAHTYLSTDLNAASPAAGSVSFKQG